jgi:hypothetical protein
MEAYYQIAIIIASVLGFALGYYASASKVDRQNAKLLATLNRIMKYGSKSENTDAMLCGIWAYRAIAEQAGIKFDSKE